MVSMTSWAPGRFGGVVESCRAANCKRTKKMVTEYGLDGRRAQVRDLVRLINGLIIRIAHRNNVALSARSARSEITSRPVLLT